ncbi:uncharacterized protein C8A04DRAFT_15539 [Dichotomopilus funicola]|uniref:Zn(2)-C6 fungal-type domain-containing protein n=1 Tax=Dichotomopilus funicola TaxID=1934379 RepID=A0AAN6UVI4_9PEZI|nr:hypothetical protein C8A04DRAFT_15539 [Dichotomopilus funicola]
MGYCGRPSTACHTCRVKRGKCDRKRPGCSQCARKRIPCPGYPDPTALVFRDQTQATARRVRATKPGYGADPFAPAISPTGGLDLTVSPDDAARTYFLTCYGPASPVDHLPELEELLRSTEVSASAFLAPALVTLSRELKDPALMALGRKHYTAALQHTNRALANTQVATKDETLASVMMLALYEALTFQGRRSPESWNAHMNGATELLKLRGPRQFDTALGRTLFLDVVGDILASCSQRRIPTPPGIVNLLSQLGPIVGPDSMHFAIAHAAAEMADIVSFVASQWDHIAVSASQIIVRARRVDEVLSGLQDQLPAHLPYTVLDPASAPASSFQGVAHCYEDPKSCWIWNNCRMMRVFLNGFVSRAALAWMAALQNAPPDAEVSSELHSESLKAAVVNVKRQGTDILASVSYCRSLPAGSHERAMAARGLTWPLSAVATSVVAPGAMKTYARDAMFSLGEEIGIPQLIDAAKMVDDTPMPEDWYVVTFNLVGLSINLC